MADVTPQLGPEAKVLQAYTNRGFRISGSEYLGALVIAGDEVLLLDVKSIPELRPRHFEMLDRFDVTYLIIGATRTAGLDATVISVLREKGIVGEIMELGAACRTYNVLRAEGRQVAAALIPAGAPAGNKPALPGTIEE